MPAAARRLHRRSGFGLVAQNPHRSFGEDLVGQDRRPDLHGTPE